MGEDFYTIDKVAEILDLHHKTIRKFIKEGKLKANKVGKQWRISTNALDRFIKKDSLVDDSSVNFHSTGEYRDRVKVSMVTDIDNISVEEYNRISSTLIAVMNSKDGSIGKSTIDIKHDRENNKVRILLWGGLEFIEYMLEYIKMLIKGNEL